MKKISILIIALLMLSSCIPEPAPVGGVINKTPVNDELPGQLADKLSVQEPVIQVAKTTESNFYVQRKNVFQAGFVQDRPIPAADLR